MIGVGDKVVCVTGGPRKGLSYLSTPKGFPVEGQIYVIRSLWLSDSLVSCGPGQLMLVLTDLPNIGIAHGFDVGWNSNRFRKLEDHRNEQELKYRREQPQLEPLYDPTN